MFLVKKTMAVELQFVSKPGMGLPSWWMAGCSHFSGQGQTVPDCLRDLAKHMDGWATSRAAECLDEEFGPADR